MHIIQVTHQCQVSNQIKLLLLFIFFFLWWDRRVAHQFVCFITLVFQHFLLHFGQLNSMLIKWTTDTYITNSKAKKKNFELLHQLLMFNNTFAAVAVTFTVAVAVVVVVAVTCYYYSCYWMISSYVYFLYFNQSYSFTDKT